MAWGEQQPHLCDTPILLPLNDQPEKVSDCAQGTATHLCCCLSLNGCSFTLLSTCPRVTPRPVLSLPLPWHQPMTPPAPPDPPSPSRPHCWAWNPPPQHSSALWARVLINTDGTAQQLKIQGEEIENGHKTFTVKSAQSAFITVTHGVRYC